MWSCYCGLTADHLTSSSSSSLQIPLKSCTFFSLDLIECKCANSDVDRGAKIFFQLQDSNRNVQHSVRDGRLLEATVLTIPARKVSQIAKPFACFCCSLSCMLKKGGEREE